MNIDIGSTAAVVGAVMTIGTPIVILSRAILKMLKKIDCNSNDVTTLKADVKESKEERQIMLKALLACLEGLHEQGCNGPVTRAIDEIKDYMMRKAHE